MKMEAEQENLIWEVLSFLLRPEDWMEEHIPQYRNELRTKVLEEWGKTQEEQ